MAKKLHKATEELAEAASKYKLSDEEREYNVIRNKIANEFGLHSTKKLTIEQLKAIQSIIEGETKTKKKVTDLWRNEVIHCKTLEEAVRICKLMHEAGLKWVNGESYLDKNRWKSEWAETCYNPFEGTVADRLYFIDEYGSCCIIHPSTDF